MEVFMNADTIAALLALVAMEIVLGVDNLIFISILVGKLPEQYQDKARLMGLGLALVARICLLFSISWLVSLTEPVFNLGIQGAPGPNGIPSYDTAFSWRDIILLSGGIFLVWKTIHEMHDRINPDNGDASKDHFKAASSLGMAVVQIILIDIVFSVDSILTAVGMTEHLPIMIAAVTIAMIIMILASKAVVEFINANPTIVMLALGFLLMIGMVLVADGFGRHIPRGYIYSAILFSCFIEFLNMRARRNRKGQQD